MVTATELVTLDYEGLALLITALTGMVTAVGVILDKRSAKRTDRLEAQGEVIRKDVNSNMTDANNRIEALHATIAEQTAAARDSEEAKRNQPFDVNLTVVQPTDEEKENGRRTE